MRRRGVEGVPLTRFVGHAAARARVTKGQVAEKLATMFCPYSGARLDTQAQLAVVRTLLREVKLVARSSLPTAIMKGAHALRYTREDLGSFYQEQFGQPTLRLIDARRPREFRPQHTRRRKRPPFFVHTARR